MANDDEPTDLAAWSDWQTCVEAVKARRNLESR
jgi:hypothetical protein